MSANHPIRIPPPTYRGSKPALIKKRTEQISLARRIEHHINSEVKKYGSKKFIYGFIANELSVEVEKVKELLSRSGGGQNGIIVVKEDATQTELS